MDSTLTQTMFMRGEVQLGKGLQLLRRKVISIPVLRGEVQQDLYAKQHPATGISIPVLRGEVQRAGRVKLYNKALISIPVLRGEVQLVFQCLITPFRKISIPVLRGEVQPGDAGQRAYYRSNFNSRTAWGSSTASICNARFIYLSEHVFADRL